MPKKKKGKGCQSRPQPKPMEPLDLIPSGPLISPASLSGFVPLTNKDDAGPLNCVVDSSKTGSVDKPQTSWANMLENNHDQPQGMKFFKVPAEGEIVKLDRLLNIDTRFYMNLSSAPVEGDTLILHEDELLDIETHFGYCLVGYFGRRFPEETAALELAKFWAVPVHFYPDDSGWVVFRFASEDHRQQVLDGGPYSSNRQILILKILTKEFKFSVKEISLLPIWVTLPNLPLALWQQTPLSRILSLVGTPIVMDWITANMERLSYARALVEVDVAKPLIRSVNIQMPSGKIISQVIKYESEPTYCTRCHRFDHILDKCLGEHMKSKGDSGRKLDRQSGKNGQRTHSAQPTAKATSPVPKVTPDRQQTQLTRGVKQSMDTETSATAAKRNMPGTAVELVVDEKGQDSTTDNSSDGSSDEDPTPEDKGKAPPVDQASSVDDSSDESSDEVPTTTQNTKDNTTEDGTCNVVSRARNQTSGPERITLSPIDPLCKNDGARIAKVSTEPLAKMDRPNTHMTIWKPRSQIRRLRSGLPT